MTVGQGEFATVPNDIISPGVFLRQRRQAANGATAERLREALLHEICDERGSSIKLKVYFSVEQFGDDLVSINHGGHPDFPLWVDLNKWAARRALVLKLVQRKTAFSGVGHVYALPNTGVILSSSSAR